MKKLLLFIFCMCCLVKVGQTQDSLRILYYNILNFPSVTPERVVELRKILLYTEPDIIVVNELLSQEGADLILTDALNVFGESKYAAANYIDGPDTDNMLYYNTDLLGLKAQKQIPTSLRDISEYQLFYKSPGLNINSDTINLNVYSLHLKAGSGFFNQRKEEILVLKYYLNSLSNRENIFVGGDFNFYSGNESGCLALRETGDIVLNDPIESIGDWNNNSAYAAIHTQSTRTSSLSDGSGGGLDDRFDLVFVSGDVLNNENGLTYIESSYKAIGQDGARFNGAINAPFNPSVPDTIVDALYLMSDHLPLIMDVKTDYTARINNTFKLEIKGKIIGKTLYFNSSIKTGTFKLYSLEGKEIMSQILSNSTEIKLIEGLSSGIYFWNLISNDQQITNKIFLN